MALLRSDSSGELYPLRAPPGPSSPSSAQALLSSTTADLWHTRLGHPGRDVLQHLSKSIGFSCSKSSPHSCHACRIGKPVRLPFQESTYVSTFPFQLLHCDVWTSPIISNSGYKLYLVILDDHSHFVWKFPLRHKSDVLPTIISFHAFVQTQFQCPILCVQTDNGKEFDNSASRAFYAKHGIALRLTCPYTSQQIGCAERVLRTINDGVRALLFQASVPSSFWPDALAASTYLLNRRPYRPRDNISPFELLFGAPPDYSHLRTFGCLCYPNTEATAPHKLAPRSARCIFLGYPMDQRGYKCYNPAMKRVLISRHVYFDESTFPFTQLSPPWSPEVPCRVIGTPDVLPLPAVWWPRAPRQQPLRAPSTPPPPAVSAPGPLPSPTPTAGSPTASAPTMPLVGVSPLALAYSQPAPATSPHDSDAPVPPPP